MEQVETDEKSVQVNATTRTKTLKKQPPLEAAKLGDVSYFLSLSPKQLRHTFSLRDDDGRSVLHVATENGHSKIVEILAKADSRKELINAKDKREWAPIHIAGECGRLRIIKILTNYGADINSENNCGRTALHYAATNGLVETCELLIKLGANVNAQDKVGFAPLHRAAGKNFTELCGVLISEGALVDVLDRTEETPLVHAFFCKQKEAVAYLIEMGADWSKLVEPDENGETLLERAPKDFKDAVSKMLPESGMM